jgi:hypothetical protein
LQLWLILIALALWECLAFLPPRGARFTLPWRGPARALRRGGLHFTSPWPLRFAFALEGSVYEALPDHALAAGPLGWLAATGALREERALAWSSALEARGAIVRMGDAPLLRAGSEGTAERVVRELRALAAAAPAARPALAREPLRAALEVSDLSASVTRVRRATLAHRALAALTLLAIGFGIPAAVLSSGVAWDSLWQNTWPYWIALHGAGFVALAGAELALAAPGRGARLLHALVYPPAQWRGSGELASAALAAAHPLAAVHALCDAESALRWARSALAECDHPRLDRTPPGVDREARVASLRERRAELAAFCERAGLAARLAEPPRRSDASASSYCPACFAEFVAAGWVCTDCGLETRPFGVDALAR